jgi:hypothetical protein
MAKNGGELGRILVGDFGYGTQEKREADGEDALFAARKNAAAEVEGSQGSLVDWGGAEIVGDQGDFFVFFGGGGYGFAELG